jgi:L-2,4-diaminobutyrate decarboxylase
MTQPTLQDQIRQLFDSDTFRSTGHAVIDLLADYLDKNLQGKGDVLDWQPPHEAMAHWQQPLPMAPTLTTEGFLAALHDEVLAGTLHIHHPRNMGHQVAPPLPLAALCDLVAALTNQAMAVYETGPSATLIERQVIRWLGDLIGWQDTEGVLTSGGAQANLTALLAARQVQAQKSLAGWDIWQQGLAAGKPLCILVSEHAHYSVSRAAGIMGLGTEAVIKVATDAAGRMQMAALEAAWQQATEQGSTVFAVAANAGCTPTGSIDPLQEIGRFCRERNIWFHVDGAHGASALLSAHHGPALDGIALADSVVWDGHKLLYMPATVSAVLFREPQHSYAAFAQQASYLFQGDSHAEETYNTSYRTLECTKRMMGLKLWAAFSLYGAERLGQLVDTVFASARAFADKLRTQPDFELLMSPETNILCFRHLAPGLSPSTLNAHQAALRLHLVRSGQFHLTQVELHDTIWLRTSIMNPMTGPSDLDALIAALRDAASRHQH